MAEKLFIRSLENGLWQWRMLSEDNEWLGENYSAGDTEALIGNLHEQSPSIYMMICGQQVASRRIDVEVKEKRHLAKLLPYEMEEEIIDSVDELHFAIGDLIDSKVSVCYIKFDTLFNMFKELEQVPGEILQCLPDYLMVYQENGHPTFVYDDGQVFVHLGEGQGFTVDSGFAPAVLGVMGEIFSEGTEIDLVSEGEEPLHQLYSWLPEKWKEDENIIINTRVGGFWGSIDLSFPEAKFSLRHGRFAKQLPILKWWELWQKPVIAVAAAFLIALTISFTEYFGAKSAFADIREETNRIYLDAVPNGRKGDPEGRLKSMLKGSGASASEPSNLMSLLSGVSQAVQKVPDIDFSSFRYNGDNRQLQLNIEAKTFQDVEKLRELIAQYQLNAELVRVSPKGDVQQARLNVSEEAQ